MLYELLLEYSRGALGSDFGSETSFRSPKMRKQARQYGAPWWLCLGCSWALWGAPGCSWALLAAPGRSWLLLGRSWRDFLGSRKIAQVTHMLTSTFLLLRVTGNFPRNKAKTTRQSKSCPSFPARSHQILTVGISIFLTKSTSKMTLLCRN